jgi:O-antigen biosynthesis protein WbqP
MNSRGTNEELKYHWQYVKTDVLKTEENDRVAFEAPVPTYERAKRLLDLVFVLCVAPIALFCALIISVIVKISSRGPVLYWSDRVGQDNKLFRMPKFRTMRIDTPPVATHLMSNPQVYLTSTGCFLRRSSLDELPQLWSVLRGDLTLVGPRPALFNQDDLIALRNEYGISRVKPGITGWAQVNGRDELPIPVKVQYDAEYAARQSWRFDLQILLKTLVKVIRSEGVRH